MLAGVSGTHHVGIALIHLGGADERKALLGAPEALVHRDAAGTGGLGAVVGQGGKEPVPSADRESARRKQRKTLVGPELLTGHRLRHGTSQEGVVEGPQDGHQDRRAHHLLHGQDGHLQDAPSGKQPEYQKKMDMFNM